MPIYTYRCENCGVQFEKMQKFTDPALIRCPECNKKTLRKVYTPVGIVFKGSGFYATDHRSPSGAPTAKNAAGTEKSEKVEKQDEKPAEVKPEAAKPSASEATASTSKAEKKD